MYFLLLMAAGFGLFVSEEALNVWVRLSYWYNMKDHPSSPRCVSTNHNAVETRSSNEKRPQQVCVFLEVLSPLSRPGISEFSHLCQVSVPTNTVRFRKAQVIECLCRLVELWDVC